MTFEEYVGSGARAGAGAPGSRHDELQLVDYPDLYLSARIGKQYHGFDVADAETVLAGVTVAADVLDLAIWPNGIIDS